MAGHSNLPGFPDRQTVAPSPEQDDQPYGVRDCAFRDPAGNLIRIQELR